MPVRDWKFRITDILEAVQDSLEITRAMDYETFCQDKRTLKAVLYNLAVIGEAARKVPEEVTVRYPAIPWREMGDMRNVVIHEYFGVDPKILWETKKTSFRLLKIVLKVILADGKEYRLARLSGPQASPALTRPELGLNFDDEKTRRHHRHHLGGHGVRGRGVLLAKFTAGRARGPAPPRDIAKFSRRNAQPPAPGNTPTRPPFP